MSLSNPEIKLEIEVMVNQNNMTHIYYLQKIEAGGCDFCGNKEIYKLIYSFINIHNTKDKQFFGDYFCSECLEVMDINHIMKQTLF